MKRVLKGLIIVSLLFIVFGCKRESLNYITDQTENGTIIYEIDSTRYVETNEKTNLIKIDVPSYGIIIAELYPEIAPITVENYKKLVDEKFFDNMIFHRVINNFMIQTGDPTGTGSGGSSETIKGEFATNGVTNDLSHTRGILSMARQGAVVDTEETMNSASSQFFIVQADSTYLDGKYAAFGKVIHGMDVVDKVASVETDTNDKPLMNQNISSIRFVNELVDSTPDKEGE